MQSRCRRLFPAWGCILLCLASSSLSSDANLLTFAHNIHCASDAQTAALQIEAIRHIELFPPGLPNQTNDSANPVLHAATLDRVLSALHDSAIRYPENKNLVEQTVVQWNFCSVIDNETFYDHQQTGKIIKRTPSPGSPLQWAGFNAFGLPPDTNDTGFDFTTPYTQTTIKPLADLQHLQRYIKHCLPHPDDEHLYRSFGRNLVRRVPVQAEQITGTVKDNWPGECKPVNKPIQITEKKPAVKTVVKVPEKAIVETPPVEIKEDPTSIATLETPPLVIEEPAPPAVVEKKPEATLPLAQAETEPVKVARKETKEEIKPNRTKDLKPARSETPQAAGTIIELAAVSEPEIDPTNNTVKRDPVKRNPAKQMPTTVALEEPKSIEEIPPPAVVTGNAPAGALTTTSINFFHGLSGSISLENRSFQAKNTSIKLAFSYKPLADSYWFARTAFNFSQKSKPTTYSWGIGYDDWHAGTWGFGLNNWGPLKPGDGLSVDTAVANLTYKFKADWLERNKLSNSLTLTKPISGEPALNWSWSKSLPKHWFVRTTLTKPLDSSTLNWSYGFGRTRYSKGTFSFEYNNWGINRFPDTNFKKNAQLSMVYRWAL